MSIFSLVACDLVLCTFEVMSNKLWPNKYYKDLSLLSSIGFISLVLKFMTLIHFTYLIYMCVCVCVYVC